MRKQFSPLRVYREDKERFDKLLNETRQTEANPKLTFPKLFKRVLNINPLKEIILTDAFAKRKSRGLAI